MPPTSRCRRRREPSCTSASPTGSRPHDLVERDEIVGYHLEQAHRYRSELDRDDPALGDLAARAADISPRPVGPPSDRGDYNAGAHAPPPRYGALPAGEPRRASRWRPTSPSRCGSRASSTRLAALLEAARGATDPVVRAMASTIVAMIDLLTVGARSADERAVDQGGRARHVLEAADHDEGLGLYWWSVAGESLERVPRGGGGGGMRAGALGICARERSARPHRRLRRGGFGAAIRVRTDPGAARRSSVSRRSRGAGDETSLQAATPTSLGRLLAMQRRGRAGTRAATPRPRDVPRRRPDDDRGRHVDVDCWIEERAGDVDGVGACLAFWARRARGAERPRLLLDRRRISRAVPLPAEVDFDETQEPVHQPYARRRPRTTHQLRLLRTRSRAACLPETGLHEEASALARHALERADTTDFYFARAESRLFLAEATSLAGKRRGSCSVGRGGARAARCEGRRDRAARARERLDELGIAARLIVVGGRC